MAHAEFFFQIALSWFCKVAVPINIPFTVFSPQQLTSPPTLCITIFHYFHSREHKMLSHCHLNLHFLDCKLQRESLSFFFVPFIYSIFSQKATTTFSLTLPYMRLDTQFHWNIFTFYHAHFHLIHLEWYSDRLWDRGLTSCFPFWIQSDQPHLVNPHCAQGPVICQVPECLHSVLVHWSLSSFLNWYLIVDLG